MTIGDIIHDYTYVIVRDLKRLYPDYVDTRKDIIIEMVAQMLLAVHLSDSMGLPTGSFISRNIVFWRAYALEIYNEEE